MDDEVVYIDIDVSKIPQIFQIELAGVDYNVQINYNSQGDFYTIDLYDTNFNPIVMGEKLIYGQYLWRHIVNEQIPSIDLLPFDLTEKETQCNMETFGKSVFLYVDDTEMGLV